MRTPFRRLCVLAGVFFGIAAPPSASAQDQFYYWVTPYQVTPPTPQTFVIEVNAARKAKIDQIRTLGGVPGFSGRVAAGSVPYNRNYGAPGRPVWNWHVAAIDSIFDHNKAVFPAVMDPRYSADPSDIEENPEQWIRDNGDAYTPTKYAIRAEINPNEKAALANVSNRGMAGAGEKTVITGFIITGGEPRTLVLRALGPTMSASGVQQPARDPKLAVFSGSSDRASVENDDWKTAARADELNRYYASLAPKDHNESALLITLLPGQYTMHGTNVDGTEGVLLLEAYDVDSASQ